MIIDQGRVSKALPGYALGEQLGSGAFGLVLAGTHRQMGRPVAIKVMATTGVVAGATGFAAEAQVLARLDHPHVVRVYDYVEDDDLCLVVMEQLAGGTLARRRNGMSAEQTCAVALAVAAALEHAHGHKVLHRDIKPDNVMFAGDGTLKVTDFGIAKLFEEPGTITSGVAGTPAYMAPEQVEGGQLGPWTDLYALGVVLYSLFTGRLPFDPKLPVFTLLQQQLTEPPPPMTGVAAPLAEVVLRVLAKSPADRPSDAAAFARELAAAATAVFGVGWTARGQLPLHLEGGVRAATDRHLDSLALAESTALVPAGSPAALVAPPVAFRPLPGDSSVRSAPPSPASNPAAPVEGASGTPELVAYSAPAPSTPPGLSAPTLPPGPGPSVGGTWPPAGASTGARGRGARLPRGAWIAGVVALILVVAAVAVLLVKSTGGPDHPTAAASTTAATASASDTPAGAVAPAKGVGSQTAGPTGSPGPTGSVAPSTAATSTPSRAAPGGASSAPSANGAVPPAASMTSSHISAIDGGDDPAQVPGSEADTVWLGNDAGCSAWLDSNGSGALAGVLNTSLNQTCGAELFRSDGNAYTFSASWAASKTNFVPVGGNTMWICVWKLDSQSTTEDCSAHFGMNGTTPVKR